MPLPTRLKSPKIASGTIGNAGVYYVCMELSLRDLIAMPTVRNAAGIDVLVSTASGDHLADLQVKTSQTKVSFWPAPAANRIPDNANVWFVFLRWLKHEKRFQGFMATASEVKIGVEQEAARQQRAGAKDFPAWNLPKTAPEQHELERRWETWSPAGFGTADRLI